MNLSTWRSSVPKESTSSRAMVDCSGFISWSVPTYLTRLAPASMSRLPMLNVPDLALGNEAELLSYEVIHGGMEWSSSQCYNDKIT